MPRFSQRSSFRRKLASALASRRSRGKPGPESRVPGENRDQYGYGFPPLLGTASGWRIRSGMPEEALFFGLSLMVNYNGKESFGPFVLIRNIAAQENT